MTPTLRACRRPLSVVALAAASTFPVVACAADDDEPRAASPPSTTTTAVVASTTSAPAIEVIDLDEGRVVLHGVPEGFTFDRTRPNTGVFGEAIRLTTFLRGAPAGARLSISVLRGPGVIEFFHRDSTRRSDVAAFDDRVYYEENNQLAEILGSASLGWEIGPDAAIWVTGSNLTIEELADIARAIEVR